MGTLKKFFKLKNMETLFKQSESLATCWKCK